MKSLFQRLKKKKKEENWIEEEKVGCAALCLAETTPFIWIALAVLES